MKAYNSIAEVKIGLKKVDSGVAGDTIFMAKCIPLFLDEISELKELLIKQQAKRKQHKRSAWVDFLSQGMKENKSIQQLANEWKLLKEPTSAKGMV